MRVFLCLLALTTAAAAGDWPQFRGPGNSWAADEKLPTTLSAETIGWKVPLTGRGLAAPIIVGEKVILCGCDGPGNVDPYVLCLDAATGKEIWTRRFWSTGRTFTHETTSLAACTPACNGQVIVALFSSNDCLCLDLDGNLRWARGLTYDYQNVSNSLGMASSVAITDQVAIVQVENDAQSLAFGLDLQTGTQRWKLERPQAANWSSPLVVKRPDGTHWALLQSTEGLLAVDALTGDTVWELAMGASSTSSTAVLGDVIMLPSDGVKAFRIGAGNEPPAEIWHNRKIGPSTASTVAGNGLVFSTNSAGALRAARVSDGELVWQMRTTGPYSATGVYAAGHLYLLNQNGLVQVVKIGEETGEVVSEYNLDLPKGDTTLGSLAAANGALYLRSDTHVWKFISK